MNDSIQVRNARVHNLKGISVDIPHNRLTVVSGVSGSGKSSLVFDTIYAEGQRRYVESLSAYARQFLERMEKPDVEEIDGIAPPIAIKQKNTTRNPRSTVATSTEIYDYLRLLFARTGRTYCPKCKTEVRKDTPDSAAGTMVAQPAGSRWYALFPANLAQNIDQARDVLFGLRKKGFTRLFQNGKTFEFSTPESLLDIDFSLPVFVLVDRLSISSEIRSRLVDTLEICFRESGEAILQSANSADCFKFSESFSCKTCTTSFSEPEPSLFSFNNPRGACRRCQGFGNTIDYDIDLIIPDRTLSIQDGAIEPWTKPQYSWYLGTEFKPAAKGRVRLNVPVCELTADEMRIVQQHLHSFFSEVESKKYKVHVRVFLSRYRGYAQCPECEGSRLRPEALYVKVGGKTIGEITRFTIEEAHRFFSGLDLSDEDRAVAETVLVEVRQRLKFLNDVGLEYLTLERLATTLSGGEAQRIVLATCLGSRLVGACYVLDEPSIGLHSRDTDRLIRILKDLRDLGNTVLVVEHDEEVIRAADHIIDMGPGAGELGGRVTFEGPLDRLLRDGEQSVTAKYLTRRGAGIQRQGARRAFDSRRAIKVSGAHAHNLKNLDVTIPLGMIVCVTGVSGSGKSTLVHEVVYKSIKRAHKRNESGGEGGLEQFETSERSTCRRVEKANLVQDVVLVDQTPIGRTPRSNPVTYIKCFDQIRELFAATPQARSRGYTAGHFSFNVPGGRCETCQGDGTVTVEMQFLADVELVCEECHGTRYKAQLLDIKYKGLNIHEVLQLTIREAISFFSETPRLSAKLRFLQEVGLGYVRLGQSATTLSGGEAQRVKLAGHLSQSTCKGTLFIFDEPTTGLHFDDIAKLIDAFNRLVQNGGSVLIIEHNMDVIRSADWIIDLGPEGGYAGGRIVAEGPPETVAEHTGSYTAKYLRAALQADAT